MKFKELIGMFKEGASVTKSPNYLKSHMKNLLEIALVDGHFDETEMDLLGKLAQKYNISEDELKKIRDTPTDDEIEVFENFFGKGEFNKSLDIQRIKGHLAERIERMNEVTSATQRMQVLRDLCIMSQANGTTTELQRATLEDIASQMKVPRSFICQSLEYDCEPD